MKFKDQLWNMFISIVETDPDKPQKCKHDWEDIETEEEKELFFEMTDLGISFDYYMNYGYESSSRICLKCEKHESILPKLKEFIAGHRQREINKQKRQQAAQEIVNKYK
jgi:hypothetical protein